MGRGDRSLTGDEGGVTPVRRRSGAIAAQMLLAAAAVLTPGAVGAHGASAHGLGADGVSVLSGAGSPAEGMFVTYVGCDAFFGPAAAPLTRLNLGPGAAPMGRRSFGLVPPTAGTAAGPTVSFDALSSAGLAVAVHATAGTTGAAYIWTITADTPPGQAWLGRAGLAVAPGAWQRVEAATTSYDWQLVDLATAQPVGPVTPATPGDFVAAHGDGAGYAVTGFGCDGRAFNIDAVQGAGRTWDFEGTTLTTTLSLGADPVPAGREVVLTGTVTDPGGRVTGDPLQLQARPPGAAQWRDVGGLVLGDRDGVSRATVAPTATTEYRWLRPESEYADAGESAPATVTVVEQPAG